MYFLLFYLLGELCAASSTHTAFSQRFHCAVDVSAFGVDVAHVRADTAQCVVGVARTGTVAALLHAAVIGGSGVGGALRSAVDVCLRLVVAFFRGTLSGRRCRGKWRLTVPLLSPCGSSSRPCRGRVPCMLR